MAAVLHLHPSFDGLAANFYLIHLTSSFFNTSQCWLTSPFIPTCSEQLLWLQTSGSLPTSDFFFFPPQWFRGTSFWLQNCGLLMWLHHNTHSPQMVVVFLQAARFGSVQNWANESHTLDVFLFFSRCLCCKINSWHIKHTVSARNGPKILSAVVVTEQTRTTQMQGMNSARKKGELSEKAWSES